MGTLDYNVQTVYKAQRFLMSVLIAVFVSFFETFFARIGDIFIAAQFGFLYNVLRTLFRIRNDALGFFFGLLFRNGNLIAFAFYFVKGGLFGHCLLPPLVGLDNVIACDPLPYGEFIQLLKASSVVLTPREV